ncbi:MAG: hypothetical protein ACPGVC_11260, partial [Salibacteraceae bacterium]
MIKKIFFWFIGVLGIVILGFSIFVLAVNFEIFGHLYTKKELKEFRNQTATRVISTDQKLIGKFFVENRTNINYSQLPN